MPSLTYSEDLDYDGTQLSEDDITTCSSVPTLMDWYDTAEAVIEDIKGQVEIAAMGGTADPDWVYKASRAAGYMRRAQSRVRARLNEVDWVPPPYRGQIGELQRKLGETKARSAVAVEFL